MSINLEYMKEQLNKDLDQEAKESGRLNPDTIEGTAVDLEQILRDAPEDDKGRKLVPDSIFDQYYKDLPSGTRNESQSKQAVNKGYITILGGDPERDKEIHRKGAEALNARNAQRRTLSDTLDILLRKKAKPEDIDTYGLNPDATYQDAIMAAMMQQAAEGNVKAGQFIRDTIGEQPTAKQDLSVTMSEDDRKLLDNISDRLDRTDSLHNDIK